MDSFTVIPTSPAERIADLDESILSARRLAWNASQMGNAASFGRVDRILTGLYTERDAIVAAHPTADFEGRLIAARRRNH
jgi:hypothetical protein